MAGYIALQPGVPTILSTAAATNFTNGVPGGTGVAAGSDTILLGLKILLNATAVTVTLQGFRSDVSLDDTTHIILTGQVGVDTYVPLNWLNTGGPLIITASVAYKVIVETLASTFLL